MDKVAGSGDGSYESGDTTEFGEDAAEAAICSMGEVARSGNESEESGNGIKIFSGEDDAEAAVYGMVEMADNSSNLEAC